VTVSILLATTGRPKRAEKCVQQLRDTTEGHSLEVIAAVDADEETARPLDPIVDVLLYEEEFRGNAKAWNDCLEVSTGDPVVLAADDLVWHPGWLDAALGRLAAFEDGWGLVGFNDGHWREDLSTHYLMSRRFIVEVLGGVVAWEAYQHSFHDLETCERAKLANRYAWCEGAVVRHEHWTFGDRPRDDTDTRTLGQHALAQQAFDVRKAAGFPNDGITPVIR
jgi:glycosyltransferase involved in cell wall biosynthesis